MEIGHLLFDPERNMFVKLHTATNSGHICDGCIYAFYNSDPMLPFYNIGVSTPACHERVCSGPGGEFIYKKAFDLEVSNYLVSMLAYSSDMTSVHNIKIEAAAANAINNVRKLNLKERDKNNA